MTVRQLAKILDAKTICENNFDREISCGYAGDLLSFVMGNAPENCAWYTIMTNVNVCAVATLLDCAVIVICQDCQPDDILVEKAKSQGINLISVKLDVYSAIEKVATSK